MKVSPFAKKAEVLSFHYAHLNGFPNI